MSNFSTNINNNILTISIDVKKESMNVFNTAIMEEFTTLFEKIESDENIKAVIVTSGKPDSFIAGADIKMLQKAKSTEEGTAIVTQAHELLQKISQCRKPFIAAIHGVCLGAGYELSLACHYRIATNDPKTKIGLPEVMLGLLPGATGTTRLSRLIALPKALDLLLSGKQLDSKRALKQGLIDEVVPYSVLFSVAEKTALRLAKNPFKRKPLPWLQQLLKLPYLRDFVIQQAKKQVLKKTHGLYPAPLAILDVVQKGLGQSEVNALEYEAKKFGELTATPEAKQLINLYFATTELKKETFIATKVKPRKILKVGVLGGGLMGAGIATVSIDKANTAVRIKDVSDTGLIAAYQHIYQYYRGRIKRRILSKEQSQQKRNLLTTTLTYEGLKNCDLVIEAVFEDINLKHSILNDIESLGNEELIFASNTSSIPLQEIAAKSQRPDKVIGMHYFSPVEKMPLLEIIRHPKTSDETLTTAVEFGRKQGKTVIVVNDGAGFYVNRILAPYLNAALELGLKGVRFDQIDNALVNFGFPVGPIKLLDEVGIDVGSKIMPVLESAFGERMKSPGIQKIFIDNGRLGKKTKKGFYVYGKNKKKQKSEIDETIYEELGIRKQLNMQSKDIVNYCVYRLLNEAVLCLDEGIIESPRDGDIGAVFGIGFPPLLGGPFRYLETVGVQQFTHEMKALEQQYGHCYTPAKSLSLLSGWY